MSKYLIDTNFLARILLQDDQKQVQTVLDFIDTSVEKNLEMYIDKTVVFELIYVLSGKIYQLDRQEVFDKITALIDLNCFTFESLEVLLKSLDLYKNTTLDVVDCYLIQKALEEDYQFQSFDQKALKVYQSLKS
jgi:predicted nucleic-acid-binding protein